MGSVCEIPPPFLAPGLRRRRDEDDINDLESSPPRRRKTVSTVDLTGDVELVHMAQCLNIIPDPCRTSVDSGIPGAQPRTQPSTRKPFQPFNLGPIRNLPKNPPSSTSLGTGPRSRIHLDIETLPRTVESSRIPPISTPRPRTTSPPRRVTGQVRPPRPKATNQSTDSSLQPAENYFALELDSISHNGYLLRPRKTVELRDGTFLRITSIKNLISDDGEDQICLQGPKFQRARELLGLLGLKRNEVAMCSPSEKIPLSEVLKPRTLILTNAAFPKHRPAQSDEKEGRLICRWRVKIVSKQEGYMWRLQQHEADERYRMDDSELRERWRGRLVKTVKMLEDGMLEDSSLPPHKDLCEQEGFAEWSARKRNFVDLTAEKPVRREQDMKETHHTAIATNDSSLELRQTSYAPFKRSLSGVGSLGSSRYEATIDSRTPAGRFLGYFQGTYTPNPNTSPSSSRPGSHIASSPHTANKVSENLAVRPSVRSVGIPNPWNSSKKYNSGSSPFNARPKNQAYQIPGRPLTHGGGDFRSSTFLGSTVTPRSIFRSNVYNNLKVCASSRKGLGRPSNYSPIPTGHNALLVKSNCSFVPQDITSSESPSKSLPERCVSLKGFGNFLKPPPPPQPGFKPIFSPPTRRRYKFGDAFCGGGGMSSGARSAGLANAWSFDFNIDAVTTYRKNFPGCKTYHMSANEFVALPPEDLLVDVVHLSPPCQPHSPAHTIAGKDDDQNEASLFCVKQCLEISRPRMVTLEQTDGILNRQEWFRSLINFFTDLGFSISWKVLHGVEYGVPQTRKRLFLLAASPGESLPDFPAPKHTHPIRDKHLDSRLPPPRTVRNAISNIPYGSTCHQPLCFPSGFRPSPVDFDQPLRATILASGGPYDVHPSGLRPFTPRELACLQTFPVTHDFAGSVFQKKKQIGNAVPPVLAEALLREVRKAMEKADRERSKKAENIKKVENMKKVRGVKKGENIKKAGDVKKVGDVNVKSGGKVGDVVGVSAAKTGDAGPKNVTMTDVQTTVDILDDEGKVKILQSLGGVPLVAVE